MDELEITVFDEIKDYKEKIYFFNFRQWVFAIIIVALVVPTYLILKDKIGSEATSYIVIAIAGVFGFIGFVKIHELPAEKILPYWARHYFIFAKPVHYMTDSEFEQLHQKKGKSYANLSKDEIRKSKLEIKEMRKNQKREKILEKARKRYNIAEPKEEIKENKTVEQPQQETKDNDNNELTEKISKLSKEQQDLLLKLLER